MDSPSFVMYQDLKNFGRVSNKDMALTVLRSDQSYGDMSIRSRAANDRTFLSREVVHAQPGDIPASLFADLPAASLTLASKIVRGLGGSPQAYQEMEGHYAGSAMQAMCQALQAYRLDGRLYANAVGKIAAGQYRDPHTKADLLLMLFVATGCLGNPSAAARLVDDYAQHFLSHGLYTTETSVGEGFAAAEARREQDIRLGLLRLQGGAAYGQVMPLSCEPRGSVIGALASGPGDINTVGYDVSRQHLHIWRTPDGEWCAQGMGSTNGTTMTTGGTHETVVIEPPRIQREPGRQYPPVHIAPGDTLMLGVSTTFLVMRVAGDERS